MASRRRYRDAVDEAWRIKAECRPGNGHHPETWFPNGQKRSWATRREQRNAALRRQEQEREAKKVCERCPVRVECLEFATIHDEKEGIWGGLTPTERGQTPLR